MFDFTEVKVFASAAAESVEDVEAGRLEVWGGIVTLRDEQLRLGPVLHRLEDVTDVDELLLDRAEEGNAGLDFGLGIGSLNGGGDHGDEPALGGHLWSNIEWIFNCKFKYM